MGHHENDNCDNLFFGPFGQVRRQHGGRGSGFGASSPWGGFGAWAQATHQRPGGHGGPPPWLAGLFGTGRPDGGRGPRVRRGDVRSAILDVLAQANEREESPNGYQVIQQITERSGGAWKPSPGSVYPTIQQLQDEGLVEADDERGRRALRLSEAGATYVVENADELAAVWAPFEREEERREAHSDIKGEIGQVMGAVWQLATTGSPAQRDALVEVLVDARRRLYGILADGPDQESAEEE